MDITEKLAYASGIVDGEGSITIRRDTVSYGTYELSVNVYMESEKPIRFLGGILPGSIGKRENTWMFKATSLKASKACNLILPYLSSKTRQAELAMDFYSLGSVQGKRIVPESLAVARGLAYEKMKSFHLPNLTDMPDLNSQNLNIAYCAGLVDGEGWIGIGKSGRGFSTMLTVEMTDLAPVARFSRIFDGHVVIQQRKTKRGKLVYRCRIERKKAQEACRKMLPYLKVKREQAKLLIMYANNVALWERRLGRGNEKRTPDIVIRKRRSWVLKMKEINQCAGAETKSEQPLDEVSDSPICRDGKPAECSRNDCVVESNIVST
jgi:hypothetical protein